MRHQSLLLVLTLLPGWVACRSKPTAAKDAPSVAVSAAPAASIDVIPKEQIAAALDPGHEPPYSGPIGHVRGVVRVSGDPAPDLPDVLAKVPRGKCDDARAFYGKLFREGPSRELADVLVGVTGYKGYVPPTTTKHVVIAKGCAYESRTIAMVFGQHLEIVNKGGETFIPELFVSRQAALVVAIPGGDPVKLYPEHVGEFMLSDRTHDFTRADVFVLKYPTTAVTGIDGKFDIGDVPAGDVSVSAYLPATKQVANARVTVVAGETATVDLTIPFTAAKPAPSASP